MLSDYRNHEAVQPLQSMTAHVAHVKAERELIHITMQVLLGNLMVNAIHSTLEHSPNAFDAVRAYAVLGVNASRVIDGFVAKEQPVKTDVPGRLIREDRGTYFDVGMDSRLQRRHVCSFNRHRYGASTALPESYDSRLADAAASSLEFLVFVLIALFPADETLVYFDDAAQFVKIIARATRLSQTLQHEPSGLLGNADLFPELQTGDALPSGNEQVHGIEPFVERDVAALEDRPCTDRKIKGTGIAAIEANLGLLSDALTALALRAERAIRPEPGFEVDSRRLSGREHLEQLESADRRFAHLSSPCFGFAPFALCVDKQINAPTVARSKATKCATFAERTEQHVVLIFAIFQWDGVLFPSRLPRTAAVLVVRANPRDAHGLDLLRF